MSEQSHERPVSPGEAGTGDLAAHDGELVSEDEDLCILGHGVHPVHPDTLEDATDQTVEETERHSERACWDASWLVKLCVAFLDPSRSRHRPIKHYEPARNSRTGAGGSARPRGAG